MLALAITAALNVLYIGTRGAPLQYQLNNRRFGMSRATYRWMGRGGGTASTASY